MSKLEIGSNENSSNQGLLPRLRYRYWTRDAGVEPFPIPDCAEAPSAARTSFVGAAPVVWLRCSCPRARTLAGSGMANAQKSWPGQPLCDDGGYRIRPCNLRGGGGP